jgi:RNA polymerase sigma factor (TIGR02999 family)
LPSSSDNIDWPFDEHLPGVRGNLDEIVPKLYDELRRMAARFLRAERADHTLQPTALVHEAYLRLVDQRSVDQLSRGHFCALAARIMRRLLVDHARTHRRAKRGGGRGAVPIDDALEVACDGVDLDLVALDDALTRLAAIDAQQARVVELRYFGGLSIEETAEVLAVSPMTVKREWAMARAWLHQQLSGEDR